MNAIKPKKINDFRQKDTETSLIEMFLYPKYGPGQLWELVAEEIKNMGGKIYFNYKADSIDIKDNKVVSVSFNNSFLVVDNITYLISSMPIKDLIISMSNNVPKNIYDIAIKLNYRDFITVGILIKNINFKEIKDNWIYIQEPFVKVARIQFFNNWSPYMVKDSSLYYIGMEYMCFENDSLWSKSDDDFIDFAISELKILNIINNDNVVCDSNIVRVKKAYPSYTGIYSKFSKLREYLDSIDNLFLIGRNGMHRYNNMDHSMLSAMAAVKCIINNNIDKSSIWSVNDDDSYHETK